MVICKMAGRKVAIFKQEGDTLTLEGETLDAGDPTEGDNREIVLCGRPVQDTSKTTYDAIIPQICFRYDDDA